VDEEPAQELEKRRCRRVRRTFQVYSRQLQRFRATANDISLTGIQLTTDESLQPGQQIVLDIEFDDPHFERLHCSAQVVWSRPRDGRSFTSGLHFTLIEPSVREEIQRYIDKSEKIRSHYV
ncbi:MAG: PilZ domain-containing protein, partial [Candidatus Xenobia bacterium]